MALDFWALIFYYAVIFAQSNIARTCGSLAFGSLLGGVSGCEVVCWLGEFEREFKLYVGVFWAKFNIASICGSILELVKVLGCCCDCWDWLLEDGGFWLDTGVCWACLNIYCICELPGWELFWIGWIDCGVGNYWADFNILVIKGSLANILSDGNIGVVPVWAFDMFGVFITG